MALVPAVELYLLALDREERAMPGFRGRPNLTAIAVEMGIKSARLYVCPEAKSLLDRHATLRGTLCYAGFKFAEIRNRITHYAAEKRASGGTLPRDARRPGSPSLVGVAAEMGIDYDVVLAGNAGIKDFLSKSLTGIPLGEAYDSERLACRRVNEAALQQIKNFEDHLQVYIDTGTPIPESHVTPNVPDYEHLRKETGVSIDKLQRKTDFRRVLLAVIEVVGLRHRIVTTGGTITFKELFAYAEELRSEETRGTATSGQSVANLRSAGSKLLRILGKTGDDACEISLTADLRLTLQALTADVDNQNTARKLRSEVNGLASFLHAMQKTRDLPPAFCDALKALCERSAVRYSFVDRQLGLVSGTIYRWAVSENTPSISALPIVAALETFLGAPSGTLQSRLPGQIGRRTSRADGLSLSKLYGPNVIPHLPTDFNVLSQEKQRDIIAKIRSTIIVQDTTFSKSLRVRQPRLHRLAYVRWPKRVQEEWSAFLADQTTVVIDEYGVEDAVDEGLAERKAILHSLELFFGFLALRDEENPSSSDGEYSVAIDGLSIVLCTCPCLVEQFLEICVSFHAGHIGLVEYHVVEFALSLLVQKTSFGQHMRDWARDCPSVPGSLAGRHLEQTDVWAKFVELNYHKLSILRDRMEGLVIDVEVKYRLPFSQWPPHARTEWMELKSFKQGDLVPFGMDREPGAVWTEGGAQIALLRIEMFYGFAVLPPSPDGKAKEEGGLGLPKEKVCLAFLVSPYVVDHFVRWSRTRRGGKLNKTDHGFLILVASFLRANVGPMYQMPHLSTLLQAHASAMTQTMVDSIKADWTAGCRAAEAAIRKLAKQVDAKMVQTRNPFEPIMGIISKEQPRLAYRELILALEDRYPDLRTAPTFHHVHVRNCLTCRLLWLTCLRSRNICEMTYNEENTGHLRNIDGSWKIVIPRQNFKNPEGPFFGEKGHKADAYVKTLRDIDGLYALIEKYLRISRIFLADKKISDRLLLSSRGIPIDATIFGNIYRAFTAKHFAYNPYRGTGMMGVMPHGPHAVRHVTATDIVKNTGRFDIAAFAIQDSEASARTSYGRFQTEDRQRLADRHLDRIDLLPDFAEIADEENRLQTATAEIAKLRTENDVLRSQLDRARAVIDRTGVPAPRD